MCSSLSLPPTPTILPKDLSSLFHPPPRPTSEEEAASIAASTASAREIPFPFSVMWERLKRQDVGSKGFSKYLTNDNKNIKKILWYNAV